VQGQIPLLVRKPEMGQLGKILIGKIVHEPGHAGSVGWKGEGCQYSII